MASSRQHDRTLARRSALQLLYAGEIKGAPGAEALDEGLCLVVPGFEVDDDDLGRIGDAPLSDYALALIEGVAAHKDSIDERLGDISENWKIERMPIVDRCILRLAVFEMLYVDKVPVSVSINEAVELAKTYGGEEDSPRFVNGILGRVARQVEEAAQDAPASDGAPGVQAASLDAQVADQADGSIEPL